jgi:hypothetical protein
MNRLENLCRSRLPGVGRLIGFLLPLVGPALGLQSFALLIKYLGPGVVFSMYFGLETPADQLWEPFYGLRACLARDRGSHSGI